MHRTGWQVVRYSIQREEDPGQTQKEIGRRRSQNVADQRKEKKNKTNFNNHIINLKLIVCRKQHQYSAFFFSLYY